MKSYNPSSLFLNLSSKIIEGLFLFFLNEYRSPVVLFLYVKVISLSGTMSFSSLYSDSIFIPLILRLILIKNIESNLDRYFIASYRSALDE